MAQGDAAGVNGGQPHNVSWGSGAAGDAEWMSGKPRARLAPALTVAPSWMSHRCALQVMTWSIRSITPTRPTPRAELPSVGLTEAGKWLFDRCSNTVVNRMFMASENMRM